MRLHHACGIPKATDCLLTQLAGTDGRLPETVCKTCFKTEQELETEAKSVGNHFAAEVDELSESERLLRHEAEMRALTDIPEHLLPSLDDPDDRLATSNDPSENRSRFPYVRKLAKGALGQVFVAKDRQIPREVAIKELLHTFSDSPVNRSRFLREAKITGMLEHPNIVPVYSVGHHRDGRPYYAMRLIDGKSLRAAISELHSENPPLPPAQRDLALRRLLRRFISVCDAVGYAHSHDVIHRDIKPNNIMLGQHGETLLVDWGIAAFLDKQGQYHSPETNDEPIGTLSFMSPEQATGNATPLTIHCDIFSLGATLFSILTGNAPYTNTPYTKISPDSRQDVKNAKVRFPRSPDVTRPLKAICFRAMACNPAERYPTVQELADDIDRWLTDQPITAYQESILDRFNRHARNHRSAVIVGVAATLLASIAMAILWVRFAIIESHNP